MNDLDRTEPPYAGDERGVLTGFLNFQRDTLEWKLSGLTDEQLRRRAVEPSSMSLLGLLRHLADVERSWFRRSVAGEDAPPLYYREGARDADWDELDSASVAEVLSTWREEVLAAGAIVASRSLDDTFTSRAGTEINVRWVLTHMIEEYARHNGHADLLRERIDGAVGE
jgi:uncharacterized damage-inducible protein DinB